MSKIHSLKTKLVALKSNIRHINFRYPPGHFYSPVLDSDLLAQPGDAVPFDGEEWWQHIDLNQELQAKFYSEMLQPERAQQFPEQKTPEKRYYSDNNWFPWADAFTLAGLIQKAAPARIVEVGSGYSSAVMLDTFESPGSEVELTFIEPFPERLNSLLTEDDHKNIAIEAKAVQEVPMDVFDRLEKGDILFIDSSHVAKIGSDVTFLFLRVLPRLKAGVYIHLHDIFYPETYPDTWILEGMSWNESLLLRAFLICNLDFEICMFNAYAREAMPDLFRSQAPEFLARPGSSLWLRKRS